MVPVLAEPEQITSVFSMVKSGAGVAATVIEVFVLQPLKSIISIL